MYISGAIQEQRRLTQGISFEIAQRAGGCLLGMTGSAKVQYEPSIFCVSRPALCAHRCHDVQDLTWKTRSGLACVRDDAVLNFRQYCLLCRGCPTRRRDWQKYSDLTSSPKTPDGLIYETLVGRWEGGISDRTKAGCTSPNAVE